MSNHPSRSRALHRTSPRSHAPRVMASPVSPAKARAGRRACSRPAMASTRIPPPVRPPGRSPAICSGADEAERQRTLPAATVAVLRDTGLLGLKLPAVLGGAEADPVTQIDVIEA